MKKRLLSLLLTLGMLLGMLPPAALAAEEATFEDFFTTLEGIAAVENDSAYPFTLDIETEGGPWLKSDIAGQGYKTAAIQLTVQQAATLTFDWKVSSEERYDGMEVKIKTVGSYGFSTVNGYTYAACSGEKGGTASVNAGAGDTITIAYRKDSSGNSGSDCLWLNNFTYTLPAQVIFHANNGTEVTSSQGIFGSGSLKTNPFTYDGHVFQGWAETAEGEIRYADGDEIAIEDDTHLYAVWAPVYTLTFTVSPEEAAFGLADSEGAALSPNSGSAYTYTLENGTYIWAAAAFGYESQGEAVTVDGQDQEIQVTLEALPAFTVTFAYGDSPDGGTVEGGLLTVTTQDGAHTMAPTEPEGLTYLLPVGHVYSYSFKSQNYNKVADTIDLTGQTEAGVEEITLPLTVKTAWGGADDIVAPAAGAGTADDPYQIGSGGELAWLAQEVNGRRGSGYHAILTRDIDLGDEAWTPIGQAYATRYAAVFDGQGHTVTGLKVTGSSAGNYGLFGYVEGGSVKNLTVEGTVDLTGSGGSSYGSAGIVGCFAGTTGVIENCVNMADVTGQQNVGGVVGIISEGYGTNEKAVRNCANLGEVRSNGNKAGGVAGYVKGAVTVEDCYNRGNVTGGGWYSGGITSYMDSSYSKVQNCYTTGTVSGSGAAAVIGRKNSGSVSSLYYLEGLTADPTATAKTDTEMQSADFVSTLGAAFLVDSGNRNGGYPILDFQVTKYPVTFTVDPAQAEVTIPGAVGEYTDGTWTFQLPAGEYSYAVSLFGYGEQSGSFTVTDGPVEQAIALEPAPTRALRFQINFSDGNPGQVLPAVTLTWEGQEIAPEEGGGYLLPYGTYHYQVKAKGYAKADGDLAVSADSPDSLAVTLEPSTAWDGVEREAPAGQGTPSDPYRIESGAQLAWLADQVNGGNGSIHAQLTDEIDLGDQNWTPIGQYPNNFSGSLDGQGFTVSGLKVSGADYAGLFGYIKGGSSARASVHDLVVRGSVSGSSDAGGIAGRADYADFAHCGNEAEITGTGSGANAGGIVGRQHSYGAGITILSCYNTGAVTANRAGGIIASINDEAAITSCYNTGAITGSGYAGGIRGQNGSMIGTVANCYHAGTAAGGTNGPIQAGSTVPEDCYYLGEGGLTAVEMTTTLLGLLNGDTDPAPWKQVSGFRSDYPVLAWEKAAAAPVPGETVLAENARFAFGEDGLVTPLASWDPIAGAEAYTLTVWAQDFVWQDLTEEERTAFDLADSPRKKLLLIDERPILQGLTPAEREEYDRLLQATIVLEGGEDVPLDQLLERQNALAAFLIGHIQADTSLGNYVPQIRQATVLHQIAGTEFDFSQTFASLGEGRYNFTATAEGAPVPTLEEVQEQVCGYQDRYDRMVPITGLRWEGTYAVWDPKAYFGADNVYLVGLCKVDEQGRLLPDTASAVEVSGRYHRINCEPYFTIGGRYVFTVTALSDAELSLRGLSDSPESALSPVYTVSGSTIPGGDVDRTDWVAISTAEEWVALANVKDSATDPNDPTTNLQSIAWSKQYYLTADLDFSTLSAADQARTKSIGNVTHRFLGTLDGNGHRITGLTLSNLDSGLFWYVGSTGCVYDLTVDGANVLFSDNAAVLTHNNFGLIQRCAVVNTNITADTGAVLGGMVSRNYGIIRDSYVEGGTLTANSPTSTGHAGFVGSNEEGGLIERCWTSMEVATQSDYAGGFVGLGYGGTIRDCFALGDVTARSYSGGFAGRSVYHGNVYENCYAAGVLTSTGAECHGFIGGNKPDSAFQVDQSEGMSNCYYNAASPADGTPAVAKTLEELGSDAFLLALDTNNCWSRDPRKNGGLPYLTDVKAPEPPATQPITVTLTLAVYDKASYTFSRLGEEISVTLSSTGNTRLVDVMDAAQAQGLLTYSYATTSTFGRFIHTINGRAVDAPDGWMFTINGQLSNVSASLAAVPPDAEILWFEGTTENRFLPPTREELDNAALEWVDIATVEDLLALADSTDDAVLSKNYRLTADLDLAGAAFPGIGSPEHPFTGLFHGQNHTVSHLSVTGDRDVGFFRVLKGGTVKDLILTGVTVSGQTNVGLLVGRAQAVLDPSDRAKNVASLVGGCSVSGTVRGREAVGGLVGLNDGAYDADTLFSIASAVDKCNVQAEVAGTGSKIGGLVGDNRGVITKSSASGPVSAPEATMVGGLIGDSYGDVYDSHALGAVTGHGTVGGFVGSASGQVTRCYSLGNVTGTEYTGGFAGSLFSADTAMSAGSVTVSGTSATGYIGGFAGSLNGTVVGVENQITVKNAYGNCIPSQGDPLSPVGNSSRFTGDGQKAALEAMTLTTRPAVRETLYRLFGVELPAAPEAACLVDVLLVSADTAAGSALSLLRPGQTLPQGMILTYAAAEGAPLTGGDSLILTAPNTTAATLTVPVTVTMVQDGIPYDSKVVTVLLRSGAPAREALMDSIAGSYLEESDGWTVMDMLVYAGLEGKTSRTSDQARQNALNLLITEAASATATVSDRARLEILFRAMGVDSTRLFPANSAAAVSNAARLGQMDLTSGGYYAAPWLLLAGLQGNLTLSQEQTRTLIALLKANMGDGLFGYTWDGVAYNDPDTAGAALAALARYCPDDPEAQAVVDAILAALPGAMDRTGSLGSANSDAMVLLGLLALGRDPEEITASSGATLVDGMLSYVNPETRQFQFYGQDNALATEQGFRALAALAHFTGAPYSVYDFHTNPVAPGRATGSGTVTPPDEPGGDGTITVTLTLKTHRETWIDRDTLELREGSTVYHALTQALKDHDMTAVGAAQGYVKSITRGDVTLAEFDHGPDSGWLYQIDGRTPPVSLTSYVLRGGEEILWYYSSDWTEDDPDIGGGDHGTSTRPPVNVGDPTVPLGGLFSDTAGHWALESIQYVAGLGLMKGVDDDRFAPDMILDRAMVVTILYRLEGSPAVTHLASFPDVAADAWYADAVAWAAQQEIVLGYDDGTFGPADPITREQLAALLMRYSAYRGEDTTPRGDLAPYPDRADIGAWALEPLTWANGKGLITGRSDGTLAPRGSATRGEAATILMRFLAPTEP